jgi:hypothetical protein
MTTPRLVSETLSGGAKPPVYRPVEPHAGIYPTGTITFKYADTGNVLGTANMQTFGLTTALTTPASIVVSTLSAGSYHT